MEKKISVVITTKNEALTIRDVVRQAKKYSDEVLVIDGKSKDGTGEIAAQEGAIVYRDKGRGKGLALRMGIEKAGGPKNGYRYLVDCNLDWGQDLGGG
jgi:glycosyltransferase involved in cell wall biosynthesis